MGIRVSESVTDRPRTFYVSQRIIENERTFEDAFKNVEMSRTRIQYTRNIQKKIYKIHIVKVLNSRKRVFCFLINCVINCSLMIK